MTDRGKIRKLEESVSQFLPEQPEVMHKGTSNLMADLLKTVRDLMRELEAKERIIQTVGADSNAVRRRTVLASSSDSTPPAANQSRVGTGTKPMR